MCRGFMFFYFAGRSKRIMLQPETDIQLTTLYLNKGWTLALVVGFRSECNDIYERTRCHYLPFEHVYILLGRLGSNVFEGRSIWRINFHPIGTKSSEPHRKCYIDANPNLHIAKFLPREVSRLIQERWYRVVGILAKVRITQKHSRNPFHFESLIISLGTCIRHMR